MALDIWNRIKTLPLKSVGTPILVLMCLGMVMLPMPAFLLDMFFTFNITISMLILFVTIYTKKPTEFASFPSVLLIATLLRLSLNVASTRVILVHGHAGGASAGKVIESFGNVVMGGNFVVGLIVFAILVIINFVVITKGAGRISEVTARFTLDAMPGKQMSIDADLNAGLITQDQAKARRAEVTQEANFYGAMDGASKFVKGDAIAGILILFINVIGGMIIGIAQHNLKFADATDIYTKLTVGDGLVAQIPSLLLSVATAIIITRQNTAQDMGKAVIGEIFRDSRSPAVAAAILGIIAVVPGMPHVPFLILAALCGALAWYMKKREKKQAEAAKNAPVSSAGAPSPDKKELSWDDVAPVDVIGLEVGYRLIPMVDKKQGGELLSRVKGVRKKLSQELGFLVPAVHIRDNLDLSPNAYRITMMGVSLGEAEVYPDRELAINPGQVFGNLKGTPTKDPSFGLDAIWISKSDSDQALGYGYTVVDSATVVATHMSQILAQNAASLLGQEEVQNLLDIVSKTQPKLVENLVPGVLNLGNLCHVLQNLLNDGVPIRDMRTILTTLTDYAPRSQDPEVLTAACRIGLRRLIVQDIVGSAQVIPVITLSRDLENILHKSLQSGGADGAGIEPGLAERMQKSLSDAASRQEMEGEPAILLTSGLLRNTLARFVKNSIPGLRVLSYQEIPDDKQIKIVSAVGQ